MRDYHARMPAKKRDQIMHHFAQDLTALQTANMCRINRNTADAWYRYFRSFIVAQLKQAPRLSGHVELDQGFFRTRKKKRYIMIDGKPVPKPVTSVAVLGMIERGGRVYTHIIKRMDRRTLMPIVYMIVAPKSTVYTDEWRSFSTLSKDGYTHHKVNHRRGFAKKSEGININTIEGFWSFAKRRLAKFNGLALSTFPLHMKECEFRYNNRGDVYGVLKKLIHQEEKDLLRRADTDTSDLRSHRAPLPKRSRIRRKSHTDSAAKAH